MDLVKMSAKGQLVVPDSIRATSGFTPGDRFVAVPVEEGVLFRRMRLDEAWEGFRKISEEIQRDMKRRRVPRSVVDEAIRWAGRSS